MRISDWSSDVCSSDLGSRADFAPCHLCGTASASQQACCGAGSRVAPIVFGPDLRRPDRYSRLFYLDDSWISPAACRCCAGGDGGRQLYGGTDPRSCPMGYSCTPIPRRHASERLGIAGRSEEHTSELQSLMRISYAVFCL